MLVQTVLESLLRIDRPIRHASDDEARMDVVKEVLSVGPLAL